LELSEQWRARESALSETLGSLRASLDTTLIARARATQRIEDLEREVTRFKPDAARAQTLAIELDGEHARLGAAQSELRRLQELLHATQDKLTRSVGELTRVDVERTQLAHTLAEFIALLTHRPPPS
jgi:chromosome segregation ATPase